MEEVCCFSTIHLQKPNDTDKDISLSNFSVG